MPPTDASVEGLPRLDAPRGSAVPVTVLAAHVLAVIIVPVLMPAVAVVAS